MPSTECTSDLRRCYRSQVPPTRADGLWIGDLPDGRQVWQAGAMGLLQDLAALLVPVSCPGCGLLDVRLCRSCANWWSGPARRVERQAPRLDDLSGTPMFPVWALADYAESGRGQVVAWKDKGREDLTKVFAAALKREASAVMQQTGPIAAVIPMPSSAKSQRQRGRAHLAPLAKAAAQAVTSNGPHRVKPVWLLRKHGRSDQVGRGARARGTARLSVRRLAERNIPKGARILLLDDVVTTGATLAAAHASLTQAGYHTVGALVLAATPAPQPRPV